MLRRVGQFVCFEDADSHLGLLEAAEAALRCAPTLQRCAPPADRHVPSAAALCAMHVANTSRCWEEELDLELLAEEVEGLLRSLVALTATACKVAVLHMAAAGGMQPAAPEAAATSLAGPAAAGTAAAGAPAGPAASQAEASPFEPCLLTMALECCMLAQALVRRVASSERCDRCEAACRDRCLPCGVVGCMRGCGAGTRQRSGMRTRQMRGSGADNGMRQRQSIHRPQMSPRPVLAGAPSLQAPALCALARSRDGSTPAAAVPARFAR